MKLNSTQIKELSSQFPMILDQGDLLDAGIDRIVKYLELRTQWAKIHNLSGPQALQDCRNDVLDSFALYSVLRQDIPLVDVGTGSGVPGMILACLCPELEILLVEPLVKRTAFLNTCAHQLGLKQVKVFRDRWPCPSVIQGYSQLQLVSRAVISPEVWPVLADTGSTVVIYQYLAMHRPEWALGGFEMKGEVSYDSTEANRLIRRWERLGF